MELTNEQVHELYLNVEKLDTLGKFLEAFKPEEWPNIDAGDLLFDSGGKIYRLAYAIKQVVDVYCDIAKEEA